MLQICSLSLTRL
jgi:hypothetical protein